jgi:hypothetical protein
MAATHPKEMQERGRMEAPTRALEYRGLDGGLACDATAFCAPLARPLRAFDAANGFSDAFFTNQPVSNATSLLA